MNNKSKLTIGGIGHFGHGKTSLLVAMAMRAKALGRNAEWMTDVGILGHSSDKNKPTMNDMIEISEGKIAGSKKNKIKEREK